MICPTCGTELRDGVLMCPICGTKQEVPAPVPPKNIQNNPKIFTKTRVISVVIVLALIIFDCAKYSYLTIYMRKSTASSSMKTPLFSISPENGPFQWQPEPPSGYCGNEGSLDCIVRRQPR